VPGVRPDIEREHVVARQKAVDDKGGLKDGWDFRGNELLRFSTRFVPVSFDLYAARKQVARV
jgi:hypothetical protein